MTEQEFKYTFSSNLVKYRKLNGLTQEELAECINYSNKSVSKWERGEGFPDLYVLINICEIFKIGLSELAGQTPPSKETAAALKELERDRKAKEKLKKKALERARKQKKQNKKK